MTRLHLAVIFLLGWISPTQAFSNCSWVEKKIWYGNSDLGLRPDIDMIYDLVQYNEANSVTPNEHGYSPNLFMDTHGRILEYFYSEHSATFVAPETGDYTFYLTCDNTCMLLINGVEVLRLNMYIRIGLWSRFPANQTYVHHMYASTCVSIVAIQAEGIAIDHVGVGVKYPSNFLDRPISKYICVPEGICPCDYNNTCENGGTCIVTGLPPNGYMCECDICYTGDRCQKIVDVCDTSADCLNGGTCVHDPNINCSYCECTHCWEGQVCEIPSDVGCNPDPCVHGVCDFADNTDCYNCDCYTCWEGTNCDTVINVCPNGTECQNGGTCVSDQSINCSYCNCPPCWEGDHCETLIDACRNHNCSNGGTCIADGNVPGCYYCECPDCWEGNLCNKEVDVCHPNNPCQNGGKCVWANNDNCYKCNCKDCFTGENCEIESDCWKKYGVECKEDRCLAPAEEIKDQCPDDSCNCCVESGCYDTGENCENRCKHITAATVELLSKECRWSCDFCCPCEGKCDLMFHKRGYWKDRKARVLPDLILYERKNPFDWSTWGTYLPDFVCRCANEAAAKGYRYFGVQFYRECWAGNNFDYDHYGACNGERPSVDGGFGNCTWTDRFEENQDPVHYCCAGPGWCNYVYEIPVFQKVERCYLKE